MPSLRRKTNTMSMKNEEPSTFDLFCLGVVGRSPAQSPLHASLGSVSAQMSQVQQRQNAEGCAYNKNQDCFASTMSVECFTLPPR